MDDALRQELLAMEADDRRVRAELLAEGSLGDGYHPRMEEVHRRNAARLARIIEERGWPGQGLVGEDGARAAWFIVQHAIGNPDFQRRGLHLLRAAVAADEARALQAAYLEDRICFFEGRPQKFGTQYDWDEDGRLSPPPSRTPKGRTRDARPWGSGRWRRTHGGCGRRQPVRARGRPRTGRSTAASSWPGARKQAGGNEVVGPVGRLFRARGRCPAPGHAGAKRRRARRVPPVQCV